MASGYITFSHDYSKLGYRFFGTIRRYDRYPGQREILEVRVRVKDKKFKFKAKILAKIKRKLREISTDYLRYDTDKPTREKAIELLNSFYQKPLDPDETLTILLLKRISESKIQTTLTGEASR